MKRGDRTTCVLIGIRLVIESVDSLHYNTIMVTSQAQAYIVHAYLAQSSRHYMHHRKPSVSLAAVPPHHTSASNLTLTISSTLTLITRPALPLRPPPHDPQHDYEPQSSPEAFALDKKQQ